MKSPLSPGRSFEARKPTTKSVTSVTLSQIVAQLFFITIAVYGVRPIGELILGQMLSKIVLSVIFVPPVIKGLVALGRRLDERADTGA
jgi:hypothetical protein